jgi:hypothetical protein
LYAVVASYSVGYMADEERAVRSEPAERQAFSLATVPGSTLASTPLPGR